MGSDLSEWRKKKRIHLGGSAVDRYRADFGLSTFSDGRGIFDWNAVELDDVVAVVFNDGGGDGATATDGEIPRLIEPVRFPLFNFGLETITGLLDVAAAVALANTFDTGGRRVAADVGAGDCVLTVCDLGDGNFAVTAEEAFRCGCVAGFVLVKKEFNLRDNERSVSFGWVVGAAVAAAWAATAVVVAFDWTIGCVKVFVVRFDMVVVTQSRAPLLFGCTLVVDVFNSSSIFAGMAGGL
jgi:hypothetical protein